MNRKYLTTKTEREQLVELLEEEGFTDGLDASTEISLFDYGEIRRPSDNLVIYCRAWLGTDDWDKEEFRFDWSEVTEEEVRDYVEHDAREGFFEFVSITRESYLRSILNDRLSDDIHIINQYDGYFSETLTWDYTLAEITQFIKNRTVPEIHLEIPFTTV